MQEIDRQLVLASNRRRKIEFWRRHEDFETKSQLVIEGGRREFIFALAMRDVLNIKIDAKLILIGFKRWF